MSAKTANTAGAKVKGVVLIASYAASLGNERLSKLCAEA